MANPVIWCAGTVLHHSSFATGRKSWLITWTHALPIPCSRVTWIVRTQTALHGVTPKRRPLRRPGVAQLASAVGLPVCQAGYAPSFATAAASPSGDKWL
jgi:hypothetical protein